jgi:ribosomal protein L11 methylase PrmA
VDIDSLGIEQAQEQVTEKQHDHWQESRVSQHSLWAPAALDSICTNVIAHLLRC